jgi:hypothetical protein
MSLGNRGGICSFTLEDKRKTMKRNKLGGTLAVLTFVTVVSVVAVTPSQQAEATVTWPQEFSDVGITQVVAHGDDDLTLLSCDFTSIPSVNSFDTITDGVETSNYLQNGTFGCDARNPDTVNSDITNPDGTVYGTYKDTSVSPPVRYLLAAKNGR